MRDGPPLFFPRERSSIRARMAKAARWVGGVSYAFVGMAISWLTGCGGNSAFAPANPFPSREAVGDLAAAPAKPLPGHKVAEVPTWRVDVAGVPDAQTPLEAKYDALSAHAASLAFAKPMRCLAREVGRAYVEQNSEPDPRAQRFMAGACGVTTEHVTFSMLSGTAPAATGDDELLSKWSEKLPAIPAAAHGKPAGMWISRKGDQVALILSVTLEANDATASPVTDGQVIVRGTMHDNADMVLALVNRGPYGVAKCDADPSVTLPAYAFRCAMAPEDATAWVDVVARKPGHLLLHGVARLLARRDASAALDYAPSHHGAAASADSAQAIADGVNRVRAAAKLPALTLAGRQSEVAQRVAGHYFEAALASDERKSETIALGLIAGWEVVGPTLRGGELFSALLYGGSDTSRWIDYALESPLGRFTMLGPDARQIAVGAHPVEGNGGLAAIVTTYAFFEASDHSADADALFARLNAARTQRGLPPATRIPKLQSLAEQAGLVNAGKCEVMDALEAAMTREASRSGLAVHGWVAAATDVPALPLPAQLLAAGPLAVAIEVTHYRPEGSPWGMTLAFFLNEAGAPATTAVAPPGHARTVASK
jgi:uncharacterized protein YkwD